jgi:hypothetical protein
MHQLAFIYGTFHCLFVFSTSLSNTDVEKIIRGLNVATNVL